MDYIGTPRTLAVESKIRKAEDISSFLKHNEDNFIKNNLYDCLNEFLLQKNLKIADVVRDSHMDRTYVYQIFSGNKNPSRDKLIAIAFGLRLSAEETQRLLKISGNRELYARDRRDAIIMFALLKEKDIVETDDLLYDNDCKTILDSDI